jgi:hypothetical protein
MIPRHLMIAAALLVVAALGTAIYVERLRRPGRTPAPAQMEKPVTAPVTGAPDRVALYVADDASGTLRSLFVSVPLPAQRSERAREILRALLTRYSDPESPHPLAPGADVNNVFIVNDTLAVADMNSAFADQHRSGVQVEDLTVFSIVETLAANLPGVNRVKLVIDGKERETLAGHADLADFYDVAAVGRWVAETQNNALP